MVILMGMSLIGNTEAGDDKSSLHYKGEEKTKEKNLSRIKYDVYFGNSKHLDCHGMGICSIVVRYPDIDAPTAMFSSGDNGTLVLEVPLEYVRFTQPEKVALLQGQKDFIVESDYTLSTEVCRQLGSATPLTIKEGKYKISVNTGIFTITFVDLF